MSWPPAENPSPSPGPETEVGRATALTDRPDLLSPLDASTPPSNAADSTVLVKSTPEGADVVVNGNYMGSTQSTLRLSPGEYAISIEKAGYQTWKRSVVVTSNGSISIDATLEKVPDQ